MVSLSKYFVFLSVLAAIFGAAEEVNAKAVGASHFKCSSLIEDLQAMEKAQSQIMKSLVNNHETMAISLENYSSEVKSHPQSINKPTFAREMNESAQAFRTRGVKAKKISNDFESASRDLLKKVNQCLAKNN